MLLPYQKNKTVNKGGRSKPLVRKLFMKNRRLASLCLCSFIFTLYGKFDVTPDNCTNAFVEMVQAVHARNVIEETQKQVSLEQEKLIEENKRERNNTNQQSTISYLNALITGIKLGSNPPVHILIHQWNSQSTLYAHAMSQLQECMKKNALPECLIPRVQEELRKQKARR